MPAGLPGDSAANNTGANPNAGRAITFDPLSGPKGSPFDKDPAGKASTGALSTGIGFSPLFTMENPSTLPGYIPPSGATVTRRRGFDLNEQPGLTKPDVTAMGNSTLMYIGGGKTSATGSDTRGRPFVPVPYVNGYGMCAAGNGGGRDAGAGPTVFTGFVMNMVSGGGIANGSVITATWVNRSGATTPSGATGTFGVNNAASAAPS